MYNISKTILIALLKKVMILKIVCGRIRAIMRVETKTKENLKRE